MMQTKGLLMPTVAKQLYCSRCNKNLGEINKGRIKNGAVLLCGACNYKLLQLENKLKNIKNKDFDIFDTFKKAGINL